MESHRLLECDECNDRKLPAFDNDRKLPALSLVPVSSLVDDSDSDTDDEPFYQFDEFRVDDGLLDWNDDDDECDIDQVDHHSMLPPDQYEYYSKLINTGNTPGNAVAPSLQREPVSGLTAS